MKKPFVVPTMTEEASFADLTRQCPAVSGEHCL
jgi:hypothetical protein